MTNKISFVSLTANDNPPIPAVKAIPMWYKKAKKYFDSGDSTFKNCMSFFEAFATGYVYLTPCEITFSIKNEVPTAEVPFEYSSFITPRPAMGEFHTPIGHYEHHFAWLPEWGIKAPKGYSVLYTTPLNGFTLPFTNTSGSINNDKVFQPGSIPFFLKHGFEGVIEKGTPYLQAIPFKREDWESEVEVIASEDIDYFKPGSERVKNFYKDNLWEMSRYD